MMKIATPMRTTILHLLAILFMLLIFVNSTNAQSLNSSGRCANIDRDRIATKVINQFGGKLLRVRCNPNKPKFPVKVRLLTDDGKIKTIKVPSNKVPKLP